MNKIAIPKIRPASWKIYVQGREDAAYVRSALEKAGMATGEIEEEPGLTDPALYVFEATPTAEVPLTQEELEAILAQDQRLDLVFSS